MDRQPFKQSRKVGTRERVGATSEEWRYKSASKQRKKAEVINFGIAPRRRGADSSNDELAQRSTIIIGDYPLIAAEGDRLRIENRNKKRDKLARLTAKDDVREGQKEEQYEPEYSSNSEPEAGNQNYQSDSSKQNGLPRSRHLNTVNEQPTNNRSDDYETELDEISARFADDYRGNRLNVQMHILGKSEKFMEEAIARATLGQFNLLSGHNNNSKYKPRVQIICSDTASRVISKSIKEFEKTGKHNLGKWARNFLEKGGQFMSHSRVKSRAEEIVMANSEGHTDSNAPKAKDYKEILDTYFNDISNLEMDREQTAYAADSVKIPSLLINKPGDINLKMETDAVVTSMPNSDIIKRLEEGEFIGTDFWGEGVPVKHGQNLLVNQILAKIESAIGNERPEYIERNLMASGGFVDTGISAVKSQNMRLFHAMTRQSELTRHLKKSTINLYSSNADALAMKNGTSVNAYDFFYRTPKGITLRSDLFVRGDEVNHIYRSIMPGSKGSQLYASRAVSDKYAYYASKILQNPNKPGVYVWLTDYADLNVTSAGIKDMGVAFLEVKTCDMGPNNERDYGCWNAP